MSFKLFGHKNENVSSANADRSQISLQHIRKSFEKRTNLLGLWAFLLLNLGVLALVFGSNLIVLVQAGRIANKPGAILVEQSDGRGFLVDAIPATQRTPKAIQRFTSEDLTAMFTAAPISQKKSSSQRLGFESQGQFDAGIRVPKLKGSEGGDRVTVSAYVVVMGAIAPEFRDAFLSRLATITPQGVFTGSTQIFFKIDFIGEPIPIEGKPGQWTVTVVGARYILDGDLASSSNPLSQIEPQPFRQVLYLQSVNPQFEPLPDISTELQKEIFEITAIGLRIVKMAPIDTTIPRGGDFLELPESTPQKNSKPTESTPKSKE
ncbi:hypothetical protein C7H19_20230 [Aphanothece hegewaldii CCALA 016]|uniref:Uncharacterized protein n=1 Tax=Aphanothece hegewaldii CCALA 016 TaxID=2107694 RepID=A0A2T1LSX8_9CHRO|nr:hypothetical protein [Aphanothece hegewaldii]PSF33328.1 hypothetical protein C7H19_20230 [Aphanothece hegewaldii CCALA 016]